jgi:hypothetical protein
MRFTNTVTIARSRPDVFAFLSDFENLPLWNYALRSTRQVVPGPVAVGTRYEQTRTIPKPATETFVVIAFQPDRELAIRGTLGPFHGESSYHLEATDGGTVVTNAMDLAARDGAGLLAGLARPRIRSAVAANLEALKQLLESTDG